jgi:adenylate cyclase, class 2
MPTLDRRAEIEVKLPVPDLQALRARLKQLHARKVSPRTYESNTLYDTRALDLRRRGQMIRLRIEQPRSAPGKNGPKDTGAAILTYKGPALRSSQLGKLIGSSFHRRYKIRDEAEVRVSVAGEFARILHALGYLQVFRYEKFRTTYALPGIPGLKIELDETPVGTYLELEGPVAGIDRAARLLGYSHRDYVTASYGALYVAFCRRHGRKPGDMLFPLTKKLRPRALFP